MVYDIIKVFAKIIIVSAINVVWITILFVKFEDSFV